MRFTIFTLLALASYTQAHFDPEEIFCTISQWRHQDTKSFYYVKELQQSAQVQADYMSQQSRITLTGPNGSQPGDRITQAGYLWNSYHEIVLSNDDPEKLLDQLKARYYGIITNPKFSGMGVASRKNKVTNTYYYTVDFGYDGKKRDPVFTCENFQPEAHESGPVDRTSKDKSFVSLSRGGNK